MHISVGNGFDFGDCLSRSVQFGADGVVGGGGGGSGAPWLPIGGSVRVLATHTRLTPTHQSHLHATTRTAPTKTQSTTFI